MEELVRREVQGEEDYCSRVHLLAEGGKLPAGRAESQSSEGRKTAHAKKSMGGNDFPHHVSLYFLPIGILSISLGMKLPILSVMTKSYQALFAI